MFDEQPDGDPHGECAAEIHRLQAENTTLEQANAQLFEQGQKMHADLTAARTQLQRVLDAFGGECFDWEPVRAAIARATQATSTETVK